MPANGIPRWSAHARTATRPPAPQPPNGNPLLDDDDFAWTEDLHLLFKACLRRWSAQSRRSRQAEHHHGEAWIDLSQCLLPFLDGLALATLRYYRRPDKSLAYEIACHVFALLATERDRHVYRVRMEPADTAALPPSSMLRSLLRKFYKEQQRLGRVVEWDALEVFLKRLVRNEVRRVVRAGRHNWQRVDMPATLLAPTPPVSEEQLRQTIAELQARLGEGVLNDTLREELNEILGELPKGDGARRTRLCRLRKRVKELLEEVGPF